MLSRDPRARARAARLGDGARPSRWDPLERAGARGRRWPGATRSCTWPARPIAQRWSAGAKRAIRDSRVTGTRQPASRACAQAEPRPRVLVSVLGGRLLRRRTARSRSTRRRPPGRDFLAEVCVAWEARGASAPASSGVRVVRVRTGVVLDRDGGALAKMLPPFRLGVGGPVAGGRQYMLLDPRRRPRRDHRSRRSTDERWSGPGQRDRARAGHQPRVLARARARAAPPGAAARARRSRCGRCTARWPRSSRAARASCRPRRWCSATSSATPSSTRRCARRSGARARRRVHAHGRRRRRLGRGARSRAARGSRSR